VPTKQQGKDLAALTRDEFTAIVERANRGEAAALKDLRRLVDNSPEIWQTLGDLAGQTESATIALVADGNSLVSESIRRQLEELRTQLGGGTTDNALERLAVERIVQSWLQLQLAERHLLQATPGTPSARFWLQRQAQADRMHQSAMRSLTTVRRCPVLPASASHAGFRVAPHTLAAVADG
jgi:hypothetical protein